MSEPLPYRFQIQERHGHEPWVTQYSQEKTEADLAMIALRERNAYAREVMDDIEAQEKQ